MPTPKNIIGSGVKAGKFNYGGGESTKICLWGRGWLGNSITGEGLSKNVQTRPLSIIFNAIALIRKHTCTGYSNHDQVVVKHVFPSHFVLPGPIALRIIFSDAWKYNKFNLHVLQLYTSLYLFHILPENTDMDSSTLCARCCQLKYLPINPTLPQECDVTLYELFCAVRHGMSSVFYAYLGLSHSNWHLIFPSRASTFYIILNKLQTIKIIFSKLDYSFLEWMIYIFIPYYGMFLCDIQVNKAICLDTDRRKCPIFKSPDEVCIDNKAIGWGWITDM